MTELVKVVISYGCGSDLKTKEDDSFVFHEPPVEGSTFECDTHSCRIVKVVEPKNGGKKTVFAVLDTKPTGL